LWASRYSKIIKPIENLLNAGQNMRRLLDKIRDAIFANPLALLFFVFAAIAEYGNYQRGRELTQLCELLSYPDVTVSNPKTVMGKVATICSERLSDDGPDD
jgi:hypothetical protein